MQGRLHEAELLLEQSVRILRVAPPNYAVNLASSLGKLARVYSLQGQYALAMPLFQEAIAMGTERGGNDVAFGDALVGLAVTFRVQGEFDRAEPLLRKALAIYETTGRINSMRGASALQNFGLLRLYEQKNVEAEQYLRRALNAAQTAFGPDHPSVALVKVNLAEACLRLQKYAECESLLRHSYEIERAADHSSIAIARWLYVQAELDVKLQHDADADLHFQKAVAMLERTAGPDLPLTAEVLRAYGDFLKPSRKNESISLRRRADAILSLRK